MGKKILKLTIAILLGAALVFAFMGYSLFIGEDQGAAVVPLGGAGREGGVLIPEGEEILKMLAALKSINLDVSFFDDKVFRSLVDFSVKLVPEKVGRLNPFAPFGEGEKAANPVESSEL